MTTALHVLQRSDGVWQIEHEDALVPVSLHETRDAALDAALSLAHREHCPLAIHSRARRPVSWVDRVTRALLARRIAPSRAG